MFTYGWRGREVPGRRSNTQQHPPHGDHQICGVATGPPTVALTSTAAEMLGLRETWKHPPSPMSECSATVAVPGVLAGVCVCGGTPTCPSPTHHRAPPWVPPWPRALGPGPQQLSPRRWLPGSGGRMALPALPGARWSQRSPLRPTAPGQHPPTPKAGLPHFPPDQSLPL